MLNAELGDGRRTRDGRQRNAGFVIKIQYSKIIPCLRAGWLTPLLLRKIDAQRGINKSSASPIRDRQVRLFYLILFQQKDIMGDIFSEKKIYPHEGKIKEHFKDYYDTVFVAFLPFYNIDDGHEEKFRTKKMTLEQAQQEIELLKNVPSANVEIYKSIDLSASQDIYNRGKSITWGSIVKEAGLNDESELNKALRTSIGGLRHSLRRPEFTEKLDHYISAKGISSPQEGRFSVLSKVAIYNALKLLDKNEIIVLSEFHDSTKKLELTSLAEFEFIKNVSYEDYYIYSLDKEILFTIEWDSFFFLIASNKKNMEKLISVNLFEGFLCDAECTHNWDFKAGEIEQLLANENLATPPAVKKWWEVLKNFKAN
jgi:hypothetical protein